MNYKEVIESKYNRQNWQLLLHDIFGNKIKFWNTPSVIPTGSQFAKQALWLGTITLSDNQTISIYEVELSDSVDIERNRRGIRDMLLTDWRNNGNAGAFMFCYRKNESVLRFSYVSEAWNFADDGTYQKESTDAKRFTYLLGEGHRSRTAIQQFEKLKASALSLKDLTKAFSVDAVSDMFFDGYKKQYEDIIQYITGKRMVKVSNKWEEKVMHSPCEEIMQEFAHFPNPEKAVRDYVKKLMGRLVFLQFLQKKGWLGVPATAEWGEGDMEFIQNLFAQTQDKEHFIDNVLEALFDDLNSEDEKKLPQYRTPYLNGGLFEREATDETLFPLPAEYMQSMLDFFASYNFTIDENDPDDAEVGVDPEMLGRIFENLLEDNKDKGAFYTPKEIVSYMCRESLIAYLQTDVDDEPTKEAIRQFVTTHDATTLGNIADDIDQRLKDVKICDPAIGSGAFPMGLLKELFICRTALEGISQHQAAEIKKHIIQQNIYGVDIERGAVDIARLRFWLSLIVDEETPQALPNLDFKIMQGNSLLENYEGVDLSELMNTGSKEGQLLFADEFGINKALLQEHIWHYYEVTDHNEKDRLNEQIDTTIKNIVIANNPSIKNQLDDVDVRHNQEFFLWHLFFADVFEQGGFNVVIGNPPYVSAPSQIANPVLARQRERIVKCKKYETLNEKWDLYIPFMELGIKLLTDNGVFSMIVPYPLTNQKYGKKIRKYISEKKCMVEIVDTSDIKVFDSAAVSNCIPIIVNSLPNHDIRISHADKQLNISVDYHKSTSDLVQDEKNYVWNLTKETRKGNRYPSMHVIGDFCFVSYGLRPNSDEKTAKGEFKKEDLISEFVDDIPRRKYIEAKDIERYKINRVRFLEYGTKRSPSQLVRPTFPEWFDIPKIFCNRLGNLCATYDSENKYLHNDSIIGIGLWKDLHHVTNKSITSSIKKFCNNQHRYDLESLSKQVDLYYLLGILNSNMAIILLADQRGGDYHIYPEHIRNIPIPLASKDVQNKIGNLAKRILDAKASCPSTDTSVLESEIDGIVYQLYGLTEEEIRVVESKE